MSLIELNINFNRIAKALERIGDILDREYPEQHLNPFSKPHDESDLIVLDNEKIWNLEQEDAYRQAASQNQPMES